MQDLSIEGKLFFLACVPATIMAILVVLIVGGIVRIPMPAMPTPIPTPSGEASIAAPTVEVPDRVSNRVVLEALYNNTDGPNWRNTENWLAAENICGWYGVACNDAGQVTRLDLNGNQLVGPLPAEVGQLTQLTHLDLGNNRLAGVIPPELGSLTQLQVLILSTNRLTGTIPAELGNLGNLRILSLWHNDLRGTIPVELGQLATLEVLSLWHNRLEGSIPTVLGQLENLRGLYLQNNQLSGPVPPELWTLEELTLSNNENLYATVPVAETQLSKLWYDNTSLCEPEDPAFEAQLERITDRGRTVYPVRRTYDSCP